MEEYFPPNNSFVAYVCGWKRTHHSHHSIIDLPSYEELSPRQLQTIPTSQIALHHCTPMRMGNCAQATCLPTLVGLGPDCYEFKGY
eukprot:2901509-Amphidinium_carterae.2